MIQPNEVSDLILVYSGPSQNEDQLKSLIFTIFKYNFRKFTSARQKREHPNPGHFKRESHHPNLTAVEKIK